jgi:hypothetical protein
LHDALSFGRRLAGGPKGANPGGVSHFNHRREAHDDWAPGGSLPHAESAGSGDAPDWEASIGDPAAVGDLFHHYAADAAPATGRGKPPPPMSRAELDYYLNDGPDPAAAAQGRGKPPPPMSRAELDYYLNDGPDPAASGRGKPPPPMSQAELPELLDDGPAHEPAHAKSAGVGKRPPPLSQAELRELLE